MVVSRRRSPEYRGRPQWHHIDIGNDDSPFRNELKEGRTHETDIDRLECRLQVFETIGLLHSSENLFLEPPIACRLKLMRYGMICDQFLTRISAAIMSARWIIRTATPWSVAGKPASSSLRPPRIQNFAWRPRSTQKSINRPASPAT